MTLRTFGSLLLERRSFPRIKGPALSSGLISLPPAAPMALAFRGPRGSQSTASGGEPCVHSPSNRGCQVRPGGSARQLSRARISRCNLPRGLVHQIRCIASFPTFPTQRCSCSSDRHIWYHSCILFPVPRTSAAHRSDTKQAAVARRDGTHALRAIAASRTPSSRWLLVTHPLCDLTLPRFDPLPRSRFDPVCARTTSGRVCPSDLTAISSDNSFQAGERSVFHVSPRQTPRTAAWASVCVSSQPSDSKELQSCPGKPVLHRIRRGRVIPSGLVWPPRLLVAAS